MKWTDEPVPLLLVKRFLSFLQPSIEDVEPLGIDDDELSDADEVFDSDDDDVEFSEPDELDFEMSDFVLEDEEELNRLLFELESIEQKLSH